jgi:hypothetical protein
VQEGLGDIKYNLPKYKNLQPGQLKDLLKDWQHEILKAVNSNFNA